MRTDHALMRDLLRGLYDASQPRHPAGTPQGGQWVGTGPASGTSGFVKPSGGGMGAWRTRGIYTPESPVPPMFRTDMPVAFSQKTPIFTPSSEYGTVEERLREQGNKVRRALQIAGMDVQTSPPEIRVMNPVEQEAHPQTKAYYHPPTRTIHLRSDVADGVLRGDRDAMETLVHETYHSSSANNIYEYATKPGSAAFEEALVETLARYTSRGIGDPLNREMGRDSYKWLVDPFEAGITASSKGVSEDATFLRDLLRTPSIAERVSKYEARTGTSVRFKHWLGVDEPKAAMMRDAAEPDLWAVFQEATTLQQLLNLQAVNTHPDLAEMIAMRIAILRDMPAPRQLSQRLPFALLRTPLAAWKALYDQAQPRAPKGSPDGGQWVDSGAKGGLLKDIQTPDGGFTYSPTTGTSPTTGFATALSGHEQVMDAATLTLDDLDDYVTKHHDALVQPGHYLGAWHNPENGKVYFDVSVVFDNEADAAAHARANKQIAYFDIKGGKSVAIPEYNYRNNSWSDDAETEIHPRGADGPWRAVGGGSRQAVYEADREDAHQGRPRSLEEETRDALAALYSKDQPRHPKGDPQGGQFAPTNGPSAAPSSPSAAPAAAAPGSYAERLTARGATVLQWLDLPAEIRGPLRMEGVSRPYSTLAPDAVAGIERGLDELRAEAPNLADFMSRAKYLEVTQDPLSQAGTFFVPAPDGKSLDFYVLFNTEPSSVELAVDRNKPPFNVSDHVARSRYDPAKPASEYTKDMYAAILVHEAGHVLDGSSNGILSQALTSAVYLRTPATDQWVHDNISGYAVTGAQEAFAEVFSATIHKRPLPPELHGVRDLILDYVKAPIRMPKITPKPKAAADGSPRRVLDPEFRAWLLGADPNRPDPFGVRREMREELVRWLESGEPVEEPE